MERWWCLDCRTSVELNGHAQCEICGSDAVDTMERNNMYHTPTPSVFVPVPDVSAERLSSSPPGSIRALESEGESITIDDAIYVN